jgi:pimeloyl-ACP methyl ester carboxylesterase
MERSRAVDGFRLAYERAGSGPPVVLLHGWPGDRTDHDAVVPLLAADHDVVVPDLRGFGESDKHPEPPAEAYSAAAQARSVVGLIDELGLERPLIAGYGIGSRIAQAIARDAPERVRATARRCARTSRTSGATGRARTSSPPTSASTTSPAPTASRAR